jgi:hypothetical protein
MRKLDAGVHVVSGTPGRVKDMMEKQKVRGGGTQPSSDCAAADGAGAGDDGGG